MPASSVRSAGSNFVPSDFVSPASSPNMRSPAINGEDFAPAARMHAMPSLGLPAQAAMPQMSSRKDMSNIWNEIDVGGLPSSTILATTPSAPSVGSMQSVPSVTKLNI